MFTRRQLRMVKLSQFFERMSPGPLNRKRFLSALEFPDSVAGMRQYARQLEFAQESKPPCGLAGEAVLSGLGGSFRRIPAGSEEK